jgi:hypothetical protein
MPDDTGPAVPQVRDADDLFGTHKLRGIFAGLALDLGQVARLEVPITLDRQPKSAAYLRQFRQAEVAQLSRVTNDVPEEQHVIPLWVIL